MHLINICVIFLLFCFNKAQALIEDDLMEIKNKCQQEVPLTVEEVNKFSADPVKHVTESIQCHLKCMMEKQGMLIDGIFDVAASLKTMETYPAYKNRKSEVVAAVEECKSQSGENNCETAYMILMCLQAHEAKIFANV